MLESNLAKLYKKLFRLKESLSTVQNLTPNDLKQNAERKEVKSERSKSTCLPLHKENLKTQLDDCCKETNVCTQSLFDLALIVPSAPWVGRSCFSSIEIFVLTKNWCHKTLSFNLKSLLIYRRYFYK